MTCSAQATCEERIVSAVGKDHGNVGNKLKGALYCSAENYSTEVNLGSIVKGLRQSHKNEKFIYLLKQNVSVKASNIKAQHGARNAYVKAVKEQALDSIFAYSLSHYVDDSPVLYEVSHD